MKRWLNGSLLFLLMLGGCGDEDTGRDPAECDKIAVQIKIVAERDDELANYRGFDRTSNPCADPVPVTSGTDYGPACDELAKCLDEVH